MWAKRLRPELPGVLSLHDPRKQGRFGAEIARRLELDRELNGEGEINLIKSALVESSAVIAASRYSAEELARDGQGYGLEDALRPLGDKLIGIVNGFDASIWNPLTDVHLKARFQPHESSGKQRCKTALQQELGLPLRPEAPLFAAVGSLGWEQGGDLLAQAAESALRNDLQIAVACEEDGGETLELLQDISCRYPDRLKMHVGADEPLLHRAVAGADFLLLPWRYESCDAFAVCGQRYGALPVARAVGSLADTVVDCDGELRSGSGFLFERDSAEELNAAVQRAAAAFARGEVFDALRRRVMRIDNSWDRSARRYELVYKKLTASYTD